MDKEYTIPRYIKLTTGYKKVIQWLMKAVSKDDARPALEYVHVIEPGYFEAVDGFRIHRIKLNQYPSEDGSRERCYKELMNLKPGLYRIVLSGNFLEIEKPANDFKYPDSFSVTGHNVRLKRHEAAQSKSEEKQNETAQADTNDVLYCRFDPRFVVDALSFARRTDMIVDAPVPLIEIGLMMRVEGENEYSKFFACVMSMHVGDKRLKCEGNQIGPVIDMHLAKAPKPAKETEAQNADK